MVETGKTYKPNTKIAATREVIRSLPLLYRVMCEVLERDGYLLVVDDEND
jgi:hypothetical protein